MSLLYIVIFVAMLIVALVLYVQQNRLRKDSVQIGADISLTVDVVTTAEAAARGLSGREKLGSDEGMLFLFDAKERYGFWMKDMLIPIDILWIDEGKIVDISSNVPVIKPEGKLITYRPSVPVDTVLEVSAGFSEANGITVGEVVTYDIDR